MYHWRDILRCFPTMLSNICSWRTNKKHWTSWYWRFSNGRCSKLKFYFLKLNQSRTIRGNSCRICFSLMVLWPINHQIITILTDLIDHFLILMNFIEFSFVNLLYLIINHLQIATYHIIEANINNMCFVLQQHILLKFPFSIIPIFSTLWVL